MKRFFQIYNMQKVGDSEISLYVKDFENPEDTMKIIVVTNIVSDLYFNIVEKKGFVGTEELMNDDEDENAVTLSEQELNKEIINYFNDNIVSIDKVVRKNIFYEHFDKKLNMFKVSFKKKPNTKDFMSDYNDLILTEFQNPIEQFIVSKKLMGCSVISFDDDFVVKKKQRSSIDIKRISFEKADKFKKLKIASLATEYENGELINYVIYEHSTKTTTEGKIVSNEILPEEKQKATIKVKIFKNSKELQEDLVNTLKNPSFEMLLTHNFNSKKVFCNPQTILCDIFTFAQATMKGRDFSMSEIVETFGISYAGSNLEQEARMIFELSEHMNIVNLAREMSEISGYPFAKCFTNARAERIEYTMLHALYERYFLLFPTQLKEQKSYTGGLVLDPVRGYHENIILLLDFNSLYPSIIQEWNVCYSTIKQLKENQTAPSDMVVDEEYLFLPKILNNLVRRRNNVKKQMKNANTHDFVQYNTRQLVLKLTANSIYGCLGFSASRLCNFDMASFITQKGREILEDTKTIVDESADLKVIYGDTDSIMVLTKYPGRREYYMKAKESVLEFQKMINAKYKHIYLDFEAAFAKLLIYTKKKYAALTFDLDSHKQELKGLELVRRDYANVGTELCREVLNLILNPNDLDVKSTAVTFKEKSKDEIVQEKEEKLLKNIYALCLEYYKGIQDRPVEDFVISTVLGKDLSTYEQSSNLPHIKLGQRLKKEKNVVFVSNDVINYVMGKDTHRHINKTKENVTVFHPKEAFEVDYVWYIKNQVVPQLYRLLALIKNVQMEKIGMIFGTTDVAIPEESRVELTFFSGCCEEKVDLMTMKCTKCNKTIEYTFIKNKINNMIRTFFRNNAQKMNTGTCLECKRTYTSALYTCGYCDKELVFNFMNKEIDDLLSNIEKTVKNNPRLGKMVDEIASFSSCSGYRKIDIGSIFKTEINRYRASLQQ